MKRIFLAIAAFGMLLCGCEDLNNLEQLGDPIVGGNTSSEITDRLDQLESDVKKLQTEVSSLQTLVNALQSNDYITNVTPVVENGVEVGYLIEFAKSDAITVYHGKNGADGKDGQDGKDGAEGTPGKDGADGEPGKDGVTTEIGIRKDTDGVWYWTLDGEWLLDDSGNKVKAVGTDGQDGEDGTQGATGATGATGADGVTPQFRIESDYWQVSYDNGQTWQTLGKATGEDGKNGADAGASIFANVTWDDTAVYFELTDGTIITIPKVAGTGLSIEFDAEQGVAIVPGSTLKVKYTITGGDANTLVRVMSFYDNDGYVVAKPIDSSTGYIYIYQSRWFDGEDDPERDELFWEGKMDGATAEDFYNNTMSILVVVVDGKGNQISKALTYVEGVLASIEDVYIADADAGSVNAVVKTNVTSSSYKVEIPENAQSWLSYTPTKASVREDVLSFNVTANENDKFRGASISLMNDLGQALETFMILQRSNIAGEPVTFADAEVEKICVGRYDKNLDGVLTYEELATVTDIENLFKLNKNITSFDEFEYFTSVTEIPEEFLANCTKLTSVKLPESVTKIYSNAFYNCSSLTSIVLPENLDYCENNDYDTATTYYAYSWFKGCTSLKDVQLPSKMTELPSSCFSGCTSLETITIPEGVNTIPSQCFLGCTSLSEVKVTTSIERIEGSAFNGCSSLTSFDLSNLKVSSSDYYYNSTLGEYAFANSGLVSVTIPETVTVIYEGVFSNCENLAEVILHDNVTAISSDAFKGTSSLTSIELPLNLARIEYNAFYNSGIIGELIEGTNIKALTIPAGVTTIGSDAFRGTNVTAVKMLGTYPPIGNWDMFNSETTIYVPTESVDVYNSAEYWYDYTILPYEMMNMSLDFNCEFVGSTFVRDEEGEYFRNYVDYTLNGDESLMENVAEYGIYFYNEYDGAEYLPMDTLNVSWRAYKGLETWKFDSDDYNFIATADAKMGAYILLSNGQYIKYGQTDLQCIYDNKPSVTYRNPVCYTTTIQEDTTIRYDVVDTVYVQVEGAYWMDSAETIVQMDDGEIFSANMDFNYDGWWYHASAFSHYGDAYSCTYYFLLYLKNGETITSNFYRETFDENWNMVQIISDTYPEVAMSASAAPKMRKSSAKGATGVVTQKPVFVQLEQDSYMPTGNSRIGIVEK